MEISGKSFHFRVDPSRIIPQSLTKLGAIFLRLIDLIRFLPQRAGRLLLHLLKGAHFFLRGEVFASNRNWRRDIGWPMLRWWTDLLFYLIDLLGLGELYESLMDLGKFNTRPLHDWEIELARTVFGDAINYRRVRIDEYALLGPRQKHFCYVSFYTINSWGSMQNSTLLHELTHVWQYEQMGATYMPRAIRAQFSKMGYNYGGVAVLKAYLKRGKDFLAFNLEQQGDIVSDYYRIRDGYEPRWGNGKRQDLPVYQSFIDQLQSGW